MSVHASPLVNLSDDALRSARFRRERETDWRKLEVLVSKVEKSGLKTLSFDDARDMATYYRQAMSSLSVAREISLDQSLLNYLESLCARAYLSVYAPQESIRGSLINLFAVGIPRAVRNSTGVLFLGFLAMFLGALMAFSLYLEDASWYYTFVPEGLSGGRSPSASTTFLKNGLYDTGVSDKDRLGAFASYLFSHNTQIAIFVFALGVFCALPSFALTFYNGTILGAFLALYVDRGLGYDLFAWLSIHGVTELSAVCIACAGGAKLGLAVLNPGNKSRKHALRTVGRDATKLLILAAVMLVVAAILEGFFRQMVQSPEVRLAVGWGIGLLWFLYFAFAGRSPVDQAGEP